MMEKNSQLKSNVPPSAPVFPPTRRSSLGPVSEERPFNQILEPISEENSRKSSFKKDDEKVSSPNGKAIKNEDISSNGKNINLKKRFTSSEKDHHTPLKYHVNEAYVSTEEDGSDSNLKPKLMESNIASEANPQQMESTNENTRLCEKDELLKSNNNNKIPLQAKKSNNEVKEDDKSNKQDSTKEKLPEWDRFVTLPPPDEDETQKSEWVEVAVRGLKRFAYLFTFIMVLMLAVTSKTLILLMTSMTRVNHTVAICNQIKPYDIDPPLDHDKRYIASYHANTPARIAWLWTLYFATIAPYIFSFGRSIRIIYFKTFKIPKWQTMATVFCMETIHCIGLSIFLFVLLPQMDIIKGAMMMNSVCWLPSMIRLLVDHQKPLAQASSPPTESIEFDSKKSFQMKNQFTEDQFIEDDEDLIGIKKIKFDHMKLATNRRLARINFSLQTILIIVWTLIGFLDRINYSYLIPFALLLVSFEWWENYVVPESMKSMAQFLSKASNDLLQTRYFVFSIILPWKCAILLSIMTLHEYSQNGSEVVHLLFKNFTDDFSTETIPILRDKRNYEAHQLLDTDHNQLYVSTTWWPIWILLIHVSITYLAYAFGKFCCKVCFQSISFAIPLCLTVPSTISLLWALSSTAFQDKCRLVDTFSPFQYIFWNQSSLDMFEISWINVLILIVWLITFINQVINSLHIWKETSERLASTEQMFVSPGYNAVMIDQSLVLNRRCLKLTFMPTADEEEEKESNNNNNNNNNNDGNNGNNQNQESINKNEKDIEKNQQKNPSLSKLLFPDDDEETNQNTELPKSSYNPFINYEDHLSGLIEDKPLQDLNKSDWTKSWKSVCEEMGVEEDSIDAKCNPADDETIRIYICATMWHEDQNEMFQMLKAVMRLDYEQGCRRIAKKQFGEDKLIYEMEVNIYFDDAFEQGKTDDEDDRVINRFVEQFIDTVGPAANQVIGRNLDLVKPTIAPTPYGGKLIWKLPMGNRLVVHIKDKNLIRHRKRWSQCMYMYYLLGYRLAARKDLNFMRKKTVMNNTFVLALDGDINFRPQAVDLVVDLMKKNDNLGAACGRIHPIGGGPIVWYQKFEYAIGHWLQKATEHVIGCVLCSPGCFSLFRARALMDKSVMNKYTTKPTAALHYVQYDQGEDRWLCTLLLQRGWRIEYCAASDSYTHAPEGFAEFYTQRRRWGPSTMANIMDLLRDYKQTVKVNNNISNLYILYQLFLMLGTIISPGTIFLMVVSAMNTVLGVSTEMSLIYNMVPLLAFIFVCLQFKDNNIKITFAMLLSVIYALLMLAVLVGTVIDMSQQGFLSPNSLFFTAMMASFVVAAVMHPQEFACLFPLPIYMLFIPSMYMLLTIYSLTNMNVVSWGTREVKSKLSAKEMAKQKEEEEAKAKEAAAKKKNKSFFNLSSMGNASKHGLFTCMCCSGSNDNDNLNGTIHDIRTEVKEITKFIKDKKNEEDSKNVNKIKEQIIQQQPQSIDKKQSDAEESSSNDDKKLNENEQQQEQQQKSDANPKEGIARAPSTASKMNDTNFKKPRWIKSNQRLDKWNVKPIPEREKEFWLRMMSKYLYPLDEDLKEKQRVIQELIDLRNKYVFAFGFLNIIFILFVFMLQLHKDVFGIDIPVGFNGTSIEYDADEDREIPIQNVIYTRMDPINLTLTVFFGAILVVQCIGMFIHRFGTLAHLLAYTEINETKRDFDYSSFVGQLIKDQATLQNKRKRRKRKNLKKSPSIDKNTNADDDDDDHETSENAQNGQNKYNQVNCLRFDEDYMNTDDSDSEPDGKPTSVLEPDQFSMIVEKALQDLKSDQSKIDKMPKVMRQNTIRAIKRHEMRQQIQQQQNRQSMIRQRRDSIISNNSHLSLNVEAINQLKLADENSIASNVTDKSQETLVDMNELRSKKTNLKSQNSALVMASTSF